jgi:SOS-response transcriptional repressor LexA
MQTTIKRLYQWLESKDESIYKFSKNIGVSNGYFSKQKKSNGAISSNVIEKIVNYYDNLNLNWLLTGKGIMELEDNEILNNFNNNKFIPLIRDSDILRIDFSKLKGFDSFYIPVLQNADYLYQIHGDSMYPEYNGGDIVACKKIPLDSFFQWNKVYLFYTDQGVLMKRVKECEDKNSVKLVSSNLAFDSFEINLKDVKSIAVVIGVIKLE